MPKRVVIYARVSTSGQSCENQIAELRKLVERRGWTLAGEYVDQGISGSKGRDGRPEFDRLIRGAMRREFDVIAAWSVDRLGRSLQDLVGFLSEIEGAGVDLYLHQQGIDTTTPAGKAMFQMCGVFAEFERAMIRERVNAGLERARAQGKQLGRPRVPATVEESIRELHSGGMGKKRIAAKLGVGVGTVQRVVRAAAEA